MIFGPTRAAAAEGAILAHSFTIGSLRFKKGRRLSAEDVASLVEAEVDQVIVARLDADDVHEDAAAAALAAALTGDGLSTSAAFTGRSNLLAEAGGILVVDSERLEAVNAVHEAVTVATLPPFARVEPRQMTATIKIIPFAVPGAVLERCLAVARRGAAPALRVAAFAPRRVGLVQTALPGFKPSILDKTRDATNARLAALGSPPVEERRCAHEERAVAEAVRALLDGGCELVLVSGASAIVDRRDVVPAGIEAAGGTLLHFGMPVDPGNLILLARHGSVPVLGLPGCARSPKANGVDWMLERLVAGLDVTPADVTRMGVGGLLKETPARPLPRAEAVGDKAAAARHAPRIAALVLAAGQSRRMGPANKLLLEVGGTPMVRHVVEQVHRSRARPVSVVIGHEAEKVEAVLDGLDVHLLRNPDYAAGLSTSLHRGLGALAPDIDGVVVCLGDMPRVSTAVIDRLISAFDPLEGRAICVPTWRGKRGNPVLFAGRFIPEILTVAGDIGARHLLGAYPDLVCEVPMEALDPGAGILLDIDTPAALEALRTQAP